MRKPAAFPMPSLQIPDFRTPGQPLVPLQLKLPPDEIQALDALASKLGRTRGAVARALLIDGRRALAADLEVA